MKITKEEYAELIRISERVELIKKYLKDDAYITTSTIRVILGINEDETEEEGE